MITVSRTYGIATLIAFMVIVLISSPAFGAENWRKRIDMPTPRLALSTVVVNGKIYAIGGVTDENLVSISTMEVYDAVRRTWTKKADMPTPRSLFGASVVNGKIYVIGGWVNQGNTFTAGVEEYDPATDRWTKKTDMPTPRATLSTSVVNGKIYAIGGGDGVSAEFSNVEMYDPATDSWTQKADMPTPRDCPSTAVVSGKIYAIGGGAEGLSTVEVYNPTTDMWTPKADMYTPRWALSTSVVNGKIYAIGGVTKRGMDWVPISKVEIYEATADRWTKGADMPTPRGWFSTSAVKGKIYAIGGSSVWPPVALSTVEVYDTGFAISARGKVPVLWGKLKARF